MSVRFVIGRAGAGKTHHCLTAVREQLAAGPLDGPRLILLVPEQASLQTERALLAPPGPRVAHRAEVLSFRRIALRIVGETGPDARAALSTNGRAMVLRYLLSKLGPELRYFRNAERFPGFLERLGRTIDELFHEAVGAEDLVRVLEVPDDDPLRQHKIEDLHRIFAAYLDYLGTQRLDPSQHLEVARAQVGNCAWLRGAQVWVDSFAGFTRQEHLTLVALARCVDRLDVTLLMDAKQAGLEAPASLDTYDLFAKTARTYVELNRGFIESGIEVEPPLVLDPPTPPRFRGAPQLAELERSVFQHEPVSTPAAEPAVRVFQASDPRVEVDYVAAGIAHLVQSAGDRLRYRDIGIAARDLGPYHDLLAGALEARGIPHFIDRRRPTNHHSLVEWVRSLMQLPLDALAPATVRLLLKTGLAGLESEDCDLVENHLIATELSGLKAWSRPWKSGLGAWAEGDSPSKRRAACERIDRLNGARLALLERFGPWLSLALEHETRTSREWAAALTEQLECQEVATRLEEWARSAEENGDLDRAEEHRRILGDFREVLAELGDVLPDEPLSLRQLAQMLDSALAQFTLGLTPPTLDQVLVTGVERSRNPELKVLFVIGFNDGVFPAAPVEGAILNDDDRTWLGDRGLPLAPSARELLLDERLLAYVAFTRPSQKLIVSYAAVDESGTELRASPYLEDLCAACPGSGRLSIDDPFRRRAAWGIRGAADLAAHLAYEFGNRPPLERDGSAQRKLWNTLYDQARRDAPVSRALRPAFLALVYENGATLAPDSVAQFYPETLRTSISRLETYATCPFKHFAEWNLKLEPRRRARMQPVDIGKIHHAVLEHFIKRLLAEGRSLVDLTRDELVGLLEISLRAVTEDLPEASAVRLARDRYVIEHSRDQLGHVLRTQQAVCALGSFRPTGAEVCFGFEGENTLPPLAVDTPAGRQVLLRGVIDRVDLAPATTGSLGVVIDYKRTRDKRLDLCSAYWGLSLQLPAYLLVLQQHGEALTCGPVVPAGAFYVSLMESYDKLDHPDDAQPCDSLLPAGAYGPRGLLDLAHMGVLDHTFAESGRSDIYQAALKKDGGLSRVDSSDAAGSRDFTDMLLHTARRIGEHADRVLDGDVSVRPYRLGTFSPCSWCDKQPFCRFEFPTTPIRNLDRLTRSQVFERLRD